MAASERLSAEAGRVRRKGPLAAFAVGVALSHLALLGGLRWSWDAPGAAAAPLPAVRIRAVAAAPADSGRAAVPAAVAVPSAGEAGRPGRRPPAHRREAARAVTASAAVDAPTPVPAAPAVATDPGDDDPPPVYRTQLAPPLVLRYDVRRGAVDGTAELRWRRDAEGYALDWQIRLGDVPVLTQTSRGAVDAAGIAPLRFVDQRPSRAAAAANFRRDVGRITFSRKAADAVLVPGAQDRLSWLLQLAAIVAAEPDLRRDGAEVRLAVAGAGGEVADWRFRCQGEEAVATDTGATPALRFVREPRGPYETRAEVWLDPKEGRYLPVRVNWRSGGADDGYELRLRDAVAITAE